MKDELISYEVAKLAKEKGFNELCGYCYIEGERLIIHVTQNERTRVDCYTASTQSLLQRWLREVHKISTECYYLNLPNNEELDDTSIKKWAISIHDIFPYTTEFYEGFETYNSYEEATEIALLEALKLINNG